MNMQGVRVQAAYGRSIMANFHGMWSVAGIVGVAIARLNIANYLGAILGSGLIGAAAAGGQLRWAFIVPLALIPFVLLVAKSVGTADSTTERAAQG